MQAWYCLATHSCLQHTSTAPANSVVVDDGQLVPLLRLIARRAGSGLSAFPDVRRLYPECRQCGLCKWAARLLRENSIDGLAFVEVPARINETISSVSVALPCGL
jgi:hypothetical protein